MLPKYRPPAAVNFKACWLLASHLFFCAAAYPTVLEPRAGTIVVIGYSKQKVVIAADSRTHDTITRSDGDKECKVITLDDRTVFTPIGITTITHPLAIWPPLPSWDATQEAREVISAQKRASLRRLADIWGNRIIQHLTTDLSRDRPGIMSAWHNGNFGGALFIGFRKNISVIQVVFRYDPASDSAPWLDIQPVPLGNEMEFSGAGQNDLVLELAADKTAFARARAEEWKAKSSTIPASKRDIEKAIWWAQLTIDSGNPLVGGFIDAAQIYPGKEIRWFQQKEECKQNEK